MDRRLSAFGVLSNAEEIIGRKSVIPCTNALIYIGKFVDEGGRHGRVCTCAGIRTCVTSLLTCPSPVFLVLLIFGVPILLWWGWSLMHLCYMPMHILLHAETSSALRIGTLKGCWGIWVKRLYLRVSMIWNHSRASLEWMSSWVWKAVCDIRASRIGKKALRITTHPETAWATKTFTAARTNIPIARLLNLRGFRKHFLRVRGRLLWR